jgi:hypothetical protein
MSIVIDSSASSGDTVIIDGLTGLTDNLGAVQGQICFLVNGAFDPWSELKVEFAVSGGSSYQVLYDPANASSYQPFVEIPSVDPTQPNTYIVGYVIPQAMATFYQTHTPGKLRLTLKSSTPPTGTLYIVSCWQTLGNAQGGSIYAASWFNAATRAESPAIEAVTTTGVTFNRLIYGFNSSPYAAGVAGSVPLSPLLYYDTQIAVSDFIITGTPASGTNQGNYYLNVYREQPGETFFTFMQTQEATTWSSTTWQFTISPMTLVDGGTISYNYVSAPDVSRIYPNAFTKILPIGSCMTYSGERLYVGSGSQCWTSDYNQPFRFRNQVSFLNATVADPASGTVNTFPGENVTGIIKATGAYIGVDTILVFTNAAMYRLDGSNSSTLSRPTREIQRGCLQPWSIISYRSLVYWVDQERQVQAWDGASPRGISRYKIDDKLWNGNLLLSSLAVQNDRLYMAYQPSGQSANTNVLVYEQNLGEWCEDVITGAVTIAQLLTIDNQTYRLIYAFDNTGKIYQYEKLGATQDYGSNIAVSLTTRRFQDDGWNYFDTQRVGIVADNTSFAATVSVSRETFGNPNGFNHNGSINLNVTPNPVWALEYVNGGMLPGGLAQGIQYTLSATVQGGWTIYYAGANMKDNENSGAVDGS